MAGTGGQVFFLQQDVTDVGQLTEALFHEIYNTNGEELRGGGGGDPNRNGKVDYFFTNNADAVYHLEYKGAGPMTDASSYNATTFLRDSLPPTRYYYLSVPSGDMDGDNKLEVVVGSLEQSAGEGMFMVIESDVATGIYRDPLTVAKEYVLEQNYPNPFNPTTKISFSIPVQQSVTLTIFDDQGREVKRVLENKGLGGARYTVDWDGRNAHGEVVPSGAYFYTLKAKDFTQTRKMMLVR
jgi:hypothetical protein